jgi:iron only hydrogenase large subunit-like protein
LAASLASSSGQPSIPLSDVLARVKKFAAVLLGFEHVYDTTFSRHLSLLEHVQEFEERRTAAASGKAGAPSSVKSKDTANETCCGTHAPGECLSHPKDEGEGEGDGRLPMLASACPGWVCYAEKAHGEMLPFISRTKSPQAIMGTLVKGWLAQKWGKRCALCLFHFSHLV